MGRPSQRFVTILSILSEEVRAPAFFLLVAGLDDLGDINVALVGDDALGVVVELLLGGFDVLLDVGLDIRRDVQGLKHLIVALEHLDGVPALLLFGQGVHGSLFDVGNGVLDRAGELVHRDGLAALRGFDGGLGGFLDAVALQRGETSTTGQPS